MQPLQAIMAPTNRRLTNVVIATITSVSPEEKKNIPGNFFINNIDRELTKNALS